MERVEPTTVHSKIQAANLHTAIDSEAELKILPSATAASRSAERRAQSPGNTANDTGDYKPIDVSASTGGTVYVAAALFTLFWVGGIAAYVLGYYGAGGFERVPSTWWALLGAVTVVPAALAWFVAFALREARLLRVQAQALAHAAAVLVQPDDHAARGVMKLGKTVRRELDHFNMALEGAFGRLATLENTNAERLNALEKAATIAQDRVDKASARLGAERDKLAAFTNSLDSAVSSVNDGLAASVNEARAAARAASESLLGEQAAITAMLETLQTTASAAAARATDVARDVEKQAQRLDSASEAAAVRSEQVILRHERHRSALSETLERLKAENDHMTRALETQRDAFSKLILVMGEEAKRIDAFAADGVRRIDNAATSITLQIAETAQALAREIDRLKTQSELSSAGIGQAVIAVKSAGDASYESAGKLGAQLATLGDLAAKTTQQVDSGIGKIQTMIRELPRDVAAHAESMRGVVEGQALAINDLAGRIASAYEQLQVIEQQRQSLTAMPAPAQILAPVVTIAPQQIAIAPALAAPRLTSERPSVSAYAEQPHPKPEAQSPPAEIRGWLGLAKRLVRMSGSEDAAPPELAPAQPRNWDMKQLLQAAETPPAQGEQTPAATRHMMESLQSMAIDIDRFLEDDPPLDLLRRYRAGERNVFARRLLQILGREHTDRISRKYHNDLEFQETVDRYCVQFETLMTEASSNDRDNIMAETFLTSATGKTYLILASASGRM
jgi:hypothetical protein